VYSGANFEEVKTQWTEAAADRVRPAEDTGVSSVQSWGSGTEIISGQQISQWEEDGRMQNPVQWRTLVLPVLNCRVPVGVNWVVIIQVESWENKSRRWYVDATSLLLRPLDSGVSIAEPRGHPDLKIWALSTDLGPVYYKFLKLITDKDYPFQMRPPDYNLHHLFFPPPQNVNRRRFLKRCSLKTPKSMANIKRN
jgi:hypothetical protein